MTLSKAYKAVLQSSDLKKLISKQEGITEEAVRRWIRREDKNLTRASVLRLVKEHTGLDDDQLLEVVAETAKV